MTPQAESLSASHINAEGRTVLWHAEDIGAILSKDLVLTWSCRLWRRHWSSLVFKRRRWR